MSATSFRSVFMVASCAGAALACYLVSLRVASERAALDEVETRIVAAQRDVRLLQTEIGTRGRLAQLERWNVKVLALSAPSASQFLDGGFQLARLVRPDDAQQIQAPVVLASAPMPTDRAAPLQERKVTAGQDEAGAGGPALPVYQASLKVRAEEPKETPAFRRFASAPPASVTPPKATVSASAKKAGDKPAAAALRSMTKMASAAKVDPLAPSEAGKAHKQEATGKTQ